MGTSTGDFGHTLQPEISYLEERIILEEGLPGRELTWFDLETFTDI